MKNTRYAIINENSNARAVVFIILCCLRRYVWDAYMLLSWWFICAMFVHCSYGWRGERSCALRYAFYERAEESFYVVFVVYTKDVMRPRAVYLYRALSMKECAQHARKSTSERDEHLSSMMPAPLEFTKRKMQWVLRATKTRVITQNAQKCFIYFYESGAHKRRRKRQRPFIYVRSTMPERWER